MNAQYMADDLQAVTMTMAFGVVAVIVIGVWALIGIHARNTALMAIEDFADDFLTDRDQHADDCRTAMRELRAG